MSAPAPSRRGKGKFLLLLILLLTMAALTLRHADRIAWYASAPGRRLLIDTLRGYGPFGMILFALIQATQVIIFALPGEFIEVVGGAIYGTVGGFFVCSAGVVIGTVVVWNLAHFLGREVVESLLAREKVAKASFLQNKDRLERVIFWIFFVPGTPKDILTYLAPFTHLTLGRFLALTLVARIPSVISSTIVGANLAEGRLWLSLLTYGAVGLVAWVGMRVLKKNDIDPTAPGEAAPPPAAKEARP